VVSRSVVLPTALTVFISGVTVGISVAVIAQSLLLRRPPAKLMATLPVVAVVCLDTASGESR